jgi:mannose-6-phosphate isomerase-like protein (cupin superfamily)
MHFSKRPAVAFFTLLAGALYLPLLHAQERKVDPTFLRADANAAPEEPSDITTATCRYRPFFGEGASKLGGSGLVRYGETVVGPNGSCTQIQYPQEDQIYVVLEGSGSARYGSEDVTLDKEDFLYIPATVPHTLTNKSAAPFTVVVMGFSTKGYETAPLPSHALKDNIENVPLQLVSGHPDSTHYRILLEDVTGSDGRIKDGHVVTSLFLMEIDPGGTNFPHHHLRQEEIYQILSGQGDQVAGSGINGVEGRYPAKPGDAYFVRANATVGFYSAPGVHSRILCVRWWYPGLEQRGEGH